ncbi:GNAT family N-acetyltransferase [Lutimaribacter sp. EGI FJ00014]|nr:GNAT family N-acetyltransferase [Lutimaribacter sp. EGI FJ00014]
MMDGVATPVSEMDHVPLQQHPAHAAALRAIGAGVLAVALPDGGRANVLLRRFGPLTLALLPRGPVWADGRAPNLDDLRAVRHALPARSILLVNGDTALPATPRLLPLVTPQTIAEWDLRAALHQKWRNRLARAERAHLPICHRAMPPDPAHWLLQREATQARQRRYRPWPPALLAAHAAQGTAHLFVAGPTQAPVAAMLFLLTGRRATYQIGWVNADGRSADAHRLLLWQAARTLREWGTTLLELGTIDTDTAPGLARYKLGTGARPRVLGATALVM